MAKEPPEPSKPKGSIVDDAELVTMQKIHKLLIQLPNDGRIRVINWLMAKVAAPVIGGAVASATSHGV